YGGVVALKMSNLHNAVQPVGDLGQFVGFRQRRGYRFFVENVNSRFHQAARSSGVVDCRNGNRCSLNFAVGRYQLLDRAETTAAEFARYLVGTLEILINHPNQTDWLTSLGKLMVDARVVTSECAHADDGCVNPVVAS